MKKIITLSCILTFALLAGFNNTNGQGMMSTWVGTGVSGYSGDGGAANLAQVGTISDVCLDAARNLYIVDGSNAAIRKVNATTNVITTIAGTSISGYSGDGGPATNAQLTGPGYMCIDAAGNLYITDGGSMFSVGNSTIRKVTKATGIITTIAGSNGNPGYSGDGGPATAALINSPKGICVDNAGNIYFADNGNNCIRKITASTGKISTIAGGITAGYSGDGALATAATLSMPIAICLNNAGDIYFSDQNGAYIRKISKTTGIISAVAGNGGSFSGDGGPALAAGLGEIFGMCCDDHGDIYCDDYSCSCRKINHSTGIINVIAGDGYASGYNGDGVATASYLSEPSGLCVNPVTGDVIIADSYDARIRKATQPGFVPAGTGNIATVPHVGICPNPSTGIISLTTALYQDANVSVYNAVGGLVYSTTLTSNHTNVDLTGQPEGNYFLIFTTGAGKEVQNIVLTK